MEVPLDLDYKDTRFSRDLGYKSQASFYEGEIYEMTGSAIISGGFPSPIIITIPECSREREARRLTGLEMSNAVAERIDEADYRCERCRVPRAPFRCTKVKKLRTSTDKDGNGVWTEALEILANICDECWHLMEGRRFSPNSGGVTKPPPTGSFLTKAISSDDRHLFFDLPRRYPHQAYVAISRDTERRLVSDDRYDRLVSGELSLGDLAL